MPRMMMLPGGSGWRRWSRNENSTRQDKSLHCIPTAAGGMNDSIKMPMRFYLNWCRYLYGCTKEAAAEVEEMFAVWFNKLLSLTVSLYPISFAHHPRTYTTWHCDLTVYAMQEHQSNQNKLIRGTFFFHVIPEIRGIFIIIIMLL